MILLSPNWLKIQGVGPCWPIIWMLPFSLKFGSTWGVLAAVSIGLIADSLTLGDASYLPSFVILGFCWGRLGRQHEKMEPSFNYGFLALVGTLLVGCSLWAQKLIFHSFSSFYWFNASAIHTLIAQSLITGLIAPLLCSWLVVAWKTKYYRTI